VTSTAPIPSPPTKETLPTEAEEMDWNVVDFNNDEWGVTGPKIWSYHVGLASFAIKAGRL